MKAERGSRGIDLLFFNLGAIWGWVVNATPQPLYSCTHVKKGLVRPGAGLDGCGKSRRHTGSIPGQSSSYSVVIPTTLSRPTSNNIRISY
jgi:hypothetical protein